MCPMPWLYVSCRGYTWLYTANVPKRSQKHEMTAKVVRPSSWRQQLVGNTPYGGFMWLYAPTRGYTFESVVIPIVLLQMCNHLTRKTQRCVLYRGYTSHRGYTWLYTASVPKRSQNHIVTAKVVSPPSGRQQLVGKKSIRWFYVVIRPKSWLYVRVRGYTNRSSPDVATSYQGNPEVVMCPIPWLYVSYRGYLWLSVVIYCICTQKVP